MCEREKRSYSGCSQQSRHRKSRRSFEIILKVNTCIYISVAKSYQNFLTMKILPVTSLRKWQVENKLSKSPQNWFHSMLACWSAASQSQQHLDSSLVCLFIVWALFFLYLLSLNLNLKGLSIWFFVIYSWNIWNWRWFSRQTDGLQKHKVTTFTTVLSLVLFTIYMNNIGSSLTGLAPTPVLDWTTGPY